MTSSRSGCTRRSTALAALLLAAWPAADALAQAPRYPTRPVRLIVPFPPGGPTDVATRLVAPRLAEAWGEQVVVDNRGGANTIIGTEMGARAAPDGHTLVTVSGAFAVNATLYPKLPYDSRRDFTIIAPIAAGPGLLVVHPALPVRTAAELIALARAKPRGVIFGSSGTGSPSHLTVELIQKLSKIEFVHVPYKGIAPTMTDLLAGQVQMGIPSVSVALPHLPTGRLRALAVTSPKRWRTLPDVPTLAEGPLPGFESSLWYGLFGPAGIAPAIAAKINAEVARAVETPEARSRFEAMGIDGMRLSPAEFAAYVRAEIVKWGQVVRDSGAKPE